MPRRGCNALSPSSLNCFVKVCMQTPPNLHLQCHISSDLPDYIWYSYKASGAGFTPCPHPVFKSLFSLSGCSRPRNSSRGGPRLGHGCSCILQRGQCSHMHPIVAAHRTAVGGAFQRAPVDSVQETVLSRLTGARRPPTPGSEGELTEQPVSRAATGRNRATIPGPCKTSGNAGCCPYTKLPESTTLATSLPPRPPIPPPHSHLESSATAAPDAGEARR